MCFFEGLAKLNLQKTHATALKVFLLLPAEAFQKHIYLSSATYLQNIFIDLLKNNVSLLKLTVYLF